MTSKPASLIELTARLPGARQLSRPDDVIMSLDGDTWSPVNSVSRRKCVTFEKPPIVALYGSCMNFYTVSTNIAFSLTGTAQYSYLYYITEKELQYLKAEVKAE